MAVQQLKVKFSTDGLSQVQRDSDKARKSYAEFLESAQDAMKAADKAALAAAGNMEAVQKAEAAKEKAVLAANRAIQASYRELSIKSTADIDRQKQQAISAFEAIKKSGTASAEDISRAQSSLTQRLRQLDRQLDSTADAAERSAGGFTILKGAIATAAGGAILQGLNTLKSAVMGFGEKSVQASTEFKGFRDQLELIEGSGDKAQRVLDRLDQFASKTPSELNEVVNAYIKLGNRGIKPTNAKLTNLLDLAKSQRKSLDQLVEAVLDAQTGENERLKEFGIQAQKSGDQVTFTFGKTTKTVKATSEEITKALVSLGQIKGVAGSAEKSMQRLDGLVSNLADNATRVQRSVGDALEPLAKGLVAAVTDLLGGIADPAVIAPLKDAFADLNAAIQESTGGAGDLRDLLIGGVKDAILGVAAIARSLADYLRENPATLQQITSLLEGILQILNPIVAVIAAIVTKTVEGWINIARLIGVAIEAIQDATGATKDFSTGVNFVIGLAKLLSPQFKLASDILEGIQDITQKIIKAISTWPSKIIDAMNPLKKFQDMLGGILQGAINVGNDVGKALKNQAESTIGSGGPLIPAPGGAFHPDKFPITSPMGMRNGRFHAGVDYGTPIGTPLANIWGAGQITYAGWADGYGNMVELTLPTGRRLVMGHLSRIIVRPGQVVPAGALLGFTGNTGRSTGPHLHLEDHPGGQGGPDGAPPVRKTVVSWYGPGFDGKKTASGETFRASGRTAAHKSLPFGTKVNFRNPANGKYVTVRVNDRGPFVAGREFDLSEGAARALGIEGQGVATLEIVPNIAAAKAQTKQQKTQAKAQAKDMEGTRDTAGQLYEVLREAQSIAAGEPSSGSLESELDKVDKKYEAIFEKFNSIRIALVKLLNERVRLKKSYKEEEQQLRSLDKAIDSVQEARQRDEAIAKFQIETEKAKQALELRRSRSSTLGDLRYQVGSNQADRLDAQGQSKAAAELRKRLELEKLDLEYRQQQLELAPQLYAALATGNQEQIAYLREQLSLLDQINGNQIEEIGRKYDVAGQKAAEMAQSLASIVTDNISSGLNDLLTGAKSFGDSILGIFSGIFQGIGQMFIQMAMQLLQNMLVQQLTKLLGSLFGGGLPFFGSFTGGDFGGASFGLGDFSFGAGAMFARGGLVRGPGSETSDSIPAFLSRNEYVLRAEAVRRVGVGTLNALNSGAIHLAAGGLVDHAWGSMANNIYRGPSPGFIRGSNRQGGGNLIANINVVTPNPDGFRPSERQLGRRFVEEVKKGMPRGR